jgi:hypothetical protein
MANTSWRPEWWQDEIHGTAWERIKDALRRDWEQTRKDLHLGGHEYNQGVGNTLRQAAGREAVPPGDGPNPPHVIGDWDDVELPVGYGHGARQQYGARFAAWNTDLESVLREEWERGRPADRRPWDEVSAHVRKGYESSS